jgi:hypothetical protein
MDTIVDGIDLVLDPSEARGARGCIKQRKGIGCMANVIFLLTRKRVSFYRKQMCALRRSEKEWAANRVPSLGRGIHRRRACACRAVAPQSRQLASGHMGRGLEEPDQR